MRREGIFAIAHASPSKIIHLCYQLLLFIIHLQLSRHLKHLYRTEILLWERGACTGPCRTRRCCTGMCSLHSTQIMRFPSSLPTLHSTQAIHGRDRLCSPKPHSPHPAQQSISITTLFLAPGQWEHQVGVPSTTAATQLKGRHRAKQSLSKGLDGLCLLSGLWDSIPQRKTRLSTP